VSVGVRNVNDLTPITDDLAEIAADLVALDADITLLQADVTDILAIADGLPTLTETVGSTTTTAINTEYDLYINNAPLGVYRPLYCNVWGLYHTAAETIILRTYYRPEDAADWALQDELTLVGLIDPVLVSIELLPTRYGVKVTIERTAGNSKAYPWEAFYEI